MYDDRDSGLHPVGYENYVSIQAPRFDMKVHARIHPNNYDQNKDLYIHLAYQTYQQYQLHIIKP